MGCCVVRECDVSVEWENIHLGQQALPFRFGMRRVRGMGEPNKASDMLPYAGIYT